MTPTRFGGAIANIMGSVAKVLGHGIYYLLLFIYRRRERMIGLAWIAAIVAVGVAIWWVL
ncbi:MAG: hypothetical protein EOP59_01825 [Sphingomonadales bacterium]|nr:MAG: hypothetical protein EOP59_01825 [Sphingomonadales bacterium]